MDRLIVKFKQYLLLAGDLAVLYASLALALAARREFWPITAGGSLAWQAHVLPFSILFAVWFVVFYTNGLYDLGIAANNLRFFRIFGTSLAIAAAIATAFFYLVPIFGIAPKTILGIQLAIFATLFTLWRGLWNLAVAPRLLRSRLCFVGETEESRELMLFLSRHRMLGFDVAALICPDQEPSPEVKSLGLAIRRDFNDFTDFLRRERITVVVLGMSPRTSPELSRVLYDSIFLKTSFTDLIPFYETITARVPVSAITRVWFLENLREREKKLFEVMKRAVDLVMACVLWLGALLLLPFVALAIKLDDRGPIFFKQERVGHHGRRFKILKFRTMVENAEPDGARFSQKKDARVTRVGRMLRATRIDELPQCWNIITGEMSLIGPRPERPEFVDALDREMPFYQMRHLVRPGLTGWAQISYGYAASFEENLRKLQYDLYYIKNRSFMLDLAVALRTLGIMARAKGQ